MEFEYKVTVIIPVYNAEKSIGRTMESLFQQTIAQDLVEIILIDDGSTDGSPRICDKYAEGHNNVRVIHQENQGVSAARNAGIRSARGKYLLYLDSDDTLSKESLQNITKFFDVYYEEVDLVTYYLTYRYESNSTSTHFRFKYLKKTGVYHLKDNPNICQSTINVCVKNSLKKPIYFNTALEVEEDQLYNTENLIRTGKIGFVKEAEYIYFRRDDSASSIKIGSAHSFSNQILVHQKMLDIGKNYPAMKRYCENMLLYNFTWNIKGNSFLPPKINGNKSIALERQLTELVNQIPTQAIMQYPEMEVPYKYYLLSLKTKGRPFIYADAAALKIIDNTGELSDQTPIQAVVTQLKATAEGLYMLAYLKCLAFAFTEEKPRLFAVSSDGKRKEISTFHSQFSCFWTKFETNRFFAFHFILPWECSKKIKFEISLQGEIYSTQVLYAIKQRVHPYIGCSYLMGRTYGAICDKEGVEAMPVNAPLFLQAKQTYEKTLFKNRRKQWLARRLMEAFKNQRVWLYFDSHNSLDNGYYQFLHDIEKRDGIRRYYVYHADNPALIDGKFSGKAKRSLVPFGSVRHKCLMAAAEKVLTAFIDRVCYLPFDPDTYQYYSDLFHYEVVYLQHGVMHAKLPNMYSKEKAWQIDQIVVSTTFEKDNLLKLGYQKEDILTCGMPRLDRLQEGRVIPEKKRLLFAPSWRVSLVRTVDDVQTPVDTFYRSDYYREFSEFLKDKDLHDFLDENNLYLDVQIHPMFSCYADSFLPAGSERIQKTSFANVEDYVACITDFSSFMFDFIYLNKPVVCYFPDRDAFQSGSHSYNDFYYSLEDGFALYCEKKAEAVGFLRRLCANDFAMPPELAEKAREIYFNREANHMEELYRTLMGDK